MIIIIIIIIVIIIVIIIIITIIIIIAIVIIIILFISMIIMMIIIILISIKHAPHRPPSAQPPTRGVGGARALAHSIFLGLHTKHPPIPVRCNFFFARQMRFTTEFAMTVLSKCVTHAGFVKVA